MELGLKGRVAVVTGCSVGIGREIARMLAAEGAQTVTVARRGELLETLEREIVDAGGLRPLSIVADLYEPDAPSHIAATVSAHYPQVDIVVNNAGGSRPVTADTQEKVWQDAYMLNFTAIRKLTNEFLPGMKERNFGRIFSIGGDPEPLIVNATTIAKAGTRVWGKALSRDVAPFGITVNIISPGKIRSEQIDRNYPPEVRKEAIRQIPAGYFGEPQDLAALVVFLSSPLARYITGQLITVDGGARRGIS